jgi:hypothetical protein
MMHFLSTVLFLLTIGCAPLCAQQKRPAERPPDLSLTAIGRHHHPIATKNTAQDYFDQGLTLIYGFNHEEAARAFQHAAKLDAALGRRSRRRPQLQPGR